MITKDEFGLDFEIDQLTNSIKNVVSGDSFPTTISMITKTDLKLITKRKGWLFNWKQELSHAERDVFKLTQVDRSFW